MNIEHIKSLLTDLESDSVERTISTKDTDKFGQAICAFANDLPRTNRPGYLLIGVEDDGKIHPINITDELLINIAAIRTDGNVQPQPSMNVQKVAFEQGEIIVVEVHPAAFPPVKYKGRIWVRVGPRKSIANDDDERRLYEKRVANITTFDAMPCIGATINDLDTQLFRQHYLSQAMPEEVWLHDDRSLEAQMQSLGFFDMRFNCPTYAGILFFGKQVERFLPGAYVQYVHYDGTTRGADIKSEHKFSGNLFKILFQLDTFVDTTITHRRPTPISTLREKTILDYPHWAIRELLMNAICHRDYEAHGPVQLYQYADRIEVTNAGGLYGKANPKNFPLVNDYRNPIVAEAMKVLGFVNRFSRGVERVKQELHDNGNGKPEFTLDLGTAFLVKVGLSADAIKYYPMEQEMERQRQEQLAETEGKSAGKSTGKSAGKSTGKTFIPPLTAMEDKVLALLQTVPDQTQPTLAKTLGVSESAVFKAIKQLKAKGIIEREGGRKHGSWRIVATTETETMT